MGRKKGVLNKHHKEKPHKEKKKKGRVPIRPFLKNGCHNQKDLDILTFFGLLKVKENSTF